MIRVIIFFHLCLVCSNTSAQFQNRFWCFGDSAAVELSSVISVPSFSTVNSRGSCSSIADSIGNLIFYIANDSDGLWAGKVAGTIYNKNHQIMSNGDSVIGRQWYHEHIIISINDSPNLFYSFSIGVTDHFGLYYSKIDMNANGGLGAVIQKNIQVMPDKQADCISAVKHGNGRDWWILGRKFITGNPTNEYWLCLVSPSGVSSPVDQYIGSLNKSDLSEITFSPNGDTMLFTNGGDLIEYYNFDRCTGIISNPVTIRPPATTYSEWTWDNEFSSDGRYIYTSTSKDTTQLFQYDLQSPNPLANRVTLYQSTFPQYCGGALKRAPDGKIYFSISYENVVPSYPYPDSIYNMYNMNLSVINYPDSTGTACDFQPYSFYLGGKRTYWGLPNNPDYMLGPKYGSPCDSLSAGLNEAAPVVISNLFPNPNVGIFTINYFLPAGKKGTLEIYNIEGKKIYAIPLPRYTYMQQLNLQRQAKGIYLVKITSGINFITKKFIIE